MVITREEYREVLRCQNGTLELNQGKYSKYLPYVFTEYGVTALASILRSEIAVKMIAEIVRAFVTLHHKYINNKNDKHFIESKIIEHEEKFKFLFSYFNINKESIYLPVKNTMLIHILQIYLKLLKKN